MWFSSLANHSHIPGWHRARDCNMKRPWRKNQRPLKFFSTEGAPTLCTIEAIKIGYDEFRVRVARKYQRNLL